MEIEMDEFELKSKLRGYFKIPRELILDMFSKKISFDEFALFIIYLSFADWDKNHKTYGRVFVSNNTLSNIKGLSDYKIKENKLRLCMNKYINTEEKKKNNIDVIWIRNPDKYLKGVTNKNKDSVVKNSDSLQI